MNTPSKFLSVFLGSVMAMSLVACGGDKETPAQPPKAQNTQTSTQSSPPDSAKADAPAETPKETAPTSEPVKEADKPADAPSEPKADTTKAQSSQVLKPAPISEGKALYEKTCKVCHEQGLLDAPKLTAKADWAKRLEKGTDTLYAHSAKGFGKMPAQATGEVSEAQVYAAVDYMISQVK